MMNTSVFSDDSNYNLEQGNGIAIIGQGMGTLNCANGDNFNKMNIFVILSENTKKGNENSSSGLGIRSSQNNANFVVSLTDGSLDSDKFSLTGVLLLDEICNQSSPIMVTTSGSCGTNKIMSLTTSNGDKGTFTGNVLCV